MFIHHSTKIDDPKISADYDSSPALGDRVVVSIGWGEAVLSLTIKEAAALSFEIDAALREAYENRNETN